jgi:glutaredoxin 3
MGASVRMYTSQHCGFCRRAEALLVARGVHDVQSLRVDLDPLLREEMIRLTGRRTVPQIFIGGRHVGGYDDLAALDRQGALVPLLTTNAPPAAGPANEPRKP